MPQPSPLETALLQADLLLRAGQLDEATELYEGILRAQPEEAAALTGIARVLQGQGRSDEAEAILRRVAAMLPDLALAQMNLGVVLCENGKLEESFAVLRRHAELTFATANPTEPSHKTKHDQEQRDYLSREGKSVGFHIPDGRRVPGRAVNTDTGEIETRWKNATPQIAVIDNFLTPAALEKLRRFCRESTIWRRAYDAGYIGAMPEHGIGSPLLAQIAEELRAAYPAIFANHPLRHYWGFVYDSALSGISVHADFAAINVNFWITPDEANEDPASGGLIIWDKPAPRDWNFAKYNDDAEAAREFLGRSGAKSTTIPYRSNRAVIFDSNLFHETDRIAFKEGYLNRRINLTLLYGLREVAAR